MKHVKPHALAGAVALALGATTAGQVQASGFADDASANLQLRNFYFNRDFRDPGAQSKAEEWAQGFIFKAESGFTEGFIGFGLDVYAGLGVKLDSADERAGSGLLPNSFGDEGPGSYSEATAAAKVRLSQSVLKVGGLMPKLPIASSGDLRLLPQEFTGASLAINEIDNLDLQAGQLREVNYRNSTNSEDIRATAGGSADRFNYLGGSYAFNRDNTKIGLWGAELDDVYEQTLINLIHNQPVGDWVLGANLAYFDTGDAGNQPLDIDHQMKSLMLSAATGAHTFRLGYQHSDGDTAFPYLAETDPYIANYVQILDFTRADEKSWQARYDINFASLGVPGLSAFTRYVQGDNFTVGTSEGSEWERDIDVSYTLQSGPLKNLSVRWRNAMVRSNATRDIDENRLILNYSFALK
ncbi:OprD family porin [Halopseudomonas sp.]|uniref:OprD family porin n=1 Tax=Halopseudomonas sp. TaxID=2901191 RepID=UPI003002D47B